MLITVKQVAQRLSVSPSCIYQLVESGKLPHHRIGLGRGAIRISEDGIDRFLTSCQHSVAESTARASPSRPKLKHIKL